MALAPSLTLSLGTKAADFDLPGTDGRNYSLGFFSHAKGVVVVFTCNHCPYARAAWPILIALADDYKNRGIAFVGINPNDEKQYPEDSFEVMKKKVSEWEINFPYLRDESQETVRLYQAQCTPDIYVFDGSRKLFYHGRINDRWEDLVKVHGNPQALEEPTKEELKEALDALLAGKEPPKIQYSSMGCSIKWKS